MLPTADQIGRFAFTLPYPGLCFFMLRAHVLRYRSIRENRHSDIKTRDGTIASLKHAHIDVPKEVGVAKG